MVKDSDNGGQEQQQWHWRVSPYDIREGKQRWLVSNGHEPEMDDDISITIFWDKALAQQVVADHVQAGEAGGKE